LKIFYINLNVGSGIERTGNTILKMLGDYEVFEYKWQNPPSLVISDIVKVNPDVILINEFYPRVLKAVYFYKMCNPTVKVIFINHVADTLHEFPFSHDYRRTDRDGTVLLNNFFKNRLSPPQ